MEQNKIREEFKAFIKELTVEICTNVCLDQISTINEEYEKNNKNYKSITNKIENIIFENKNNIQQINSQNNNAIKEITEEFSERLIEMEEDLKGVYTLRNEEFDKIKTNLQEVFRQAFENEKSREEADKIVIEVAKELMGSHDAVEEAIKEVRNENKLLLQKLIRDSEEVFKKYEESVHKLNEDERNAFINTLSNGISLEKENFSADIIEIVENNIKELLNKFIRENREVQKKVNDLINGKDVENKFQSINESVVRIYNKLEKVNNDITNLNTTVKNVESKRKEEHTKQINEIVEKVTNNISLELKNRFKEANNKNMEEIEKQNQNLIKVINKLNLLEERNKKLEQYIKYIIGGLGIIVVLQLIF